ncbi:MAG: hypothetical protein WCH39_10360 [Schlesneria sp.]
MRWRFIDKNNRAEVAEREIVIRKIEAWWREFAKRADDIAATFSGKCDLDLPAWVEEHLQSIDPDLMWEFGPAIRGTGHRLVITPECDHHLRPLVQSILAKAPDLNGWEFYEHRLAEDIESAQSTVEGRTGCNLSELKFRASLGELNRIDLKFGSPSKSQIKDQSALNAAFVAAETLLGEKVLNEWIGVIDVSPIQGPSTLTSLLGLARKPPQWIGLERLYDTVNSLIGSIHDQLPPGPHYEWMTEDTPMSLWELKPESADDYVEQGDLIVGKSANRTMWMTSHRHQLFCSERFSRCHETFCYVKIDGSDGFDEAKFADKSEVEDALDEVLKPQKLGCQIGGGTGLRYSYIDLALVDVDQANEAIKQRLRAGKIPKRSWILFYDSDLAAEWIGIYDDTPPPPMKF